MRKLLAPLFFLALTTGLWILPSPTRTSLADLSATRLLDAKDPEGVTLAQRILEDARRDSTSATLLLAPTPPGTADLERGLLARLRAASESELSLPLELERGPSGGHFDLATTDELRLVWSPSGGAAPIERRAPFRPPTKTVLLPPLIAIAAAVLFRRTAAALFLGVLTGAVLLRARSGTALAALPLGFSDVFTHFFWQRLTNDDNLRTVVFVVLMLSMVGLMVRSGGLAGIMDGIARRAATARGVAVSAWLMGLAIFFDDYSNTVLVGSTMRPLFDRVRVAREKLAYIVDSTAAPVAGLSLFSTWIAFEVSTFSPQLPAAGLAPSSGYAVFLESLPFRFYSILTLVFVGLVVLSGRDFGPMRRAEERSRKGQLFHPGSKPMQGKRSTAVTVSAGVTPRAWRAIVPLVGFIAVTLGTILFRGGALELAPETLFTFEGLSGVLLKGSGTIPLIIGSATGFGLAALGCKEAGVAREIPAASLAVLSSMGTAFIILYLAWMIGSVCSELETANYLTALFSSGLKPELLPALLFGLSSLIALATGSSWSTMMILLPLVVALAFDLGQGTAIGGHALMLMSIGAVLEGSIFGDHCSPLSDTTVLSSISSASDHIDHVRTQAPYALVTMATAMLFGYLPAALLGSSPFLGLGLGAALLAVILFLFGRAPSTPEPSAEFPR